MNALYRSNSVEGFFHVEHLMRTSRRRSSNLVRTVPVHLTRASRRRSPSLVHQVHVEHLVKPSRRRSSSLVQQVNVIF